MLFRPTIGSTVVLSQSFLWGSTCPIDIPLLILQALENIDRVHLSQPLYPRPLATSLGGSASQCFRMGGS